MKITQINKVLYILLFLNLIFILNHSFSEQSINLSSIDLGKFSVSDDIPTSWMLSHTPYNSDKIILERKDIPREIIEKEKMYIWPWFTNVCSRNLRKSLEPSDIFFVSGIGEHKDDAGVFKWSYNKHRPIDPRYDPSDQYDIELIDSRFITYLVRHDSFLEKEVLDIFKEVVQYYPSSKNDSTMIPIESHLSSDGSSYGKLIVKRVTAGWFIRPIEWYKKGDYVLFVFEKVVDMPMGKAFPDIDNIDNKDKLVGGIPFSDKRSYLRFENSNRKQLIEGYFEDYYFEEAEKFSQWFIENYKPNEAQGKFAGTK